MTITEFLEARIAEDEAVARAATQGPWSVDDESYAESISTSDGSYVVSGGKWGGEASVFGCIEDAIHIARHDPARVLAECAAKRAIVKRDGWAATSACALTPLHSCFLYEDHGRAMEAYETLRILAAVYASHEDYRPEWAL